MRPQAGGGIWVLLVGCGLGLSLLGGCGSHTPWDGGEGTPDLNAQQAGSWQPPAAGPGSAVYRYGGYEMYKSGNTATDYWLYTPTQPVPRVAPVVVFNHGWSALEPSYYLAWIIHLVRKGNIVIYPRWQTGVGDLHGSAFLPNACTAVRNALTRLEMVGPLRPNRNRLAVFGYSIGGTLAADMAALAGNFSLPQAKVVFSVEPGTVSAATGFPHADDVTIADFSRIPSDVLLIALEGEDDDLVGGLLARRIYQESTGVPAANKNHLTVRTDTYGAPDLTADHMFPLAAQDRSNVDALDYYALWKIGDALLDAAFRDRNREYALGNTPKQRNMGTWPDGRVVKKMIVQ